MRSKAEIKRRKNAKIEEQKHFDAVMGTPSFELHDGFIFVNAPSRLYPMVRLYLDSEGIEIRKQDGRIEVKTATSQGWTGV